MSPPHLHPQAQPIPLLFDGLPAPLEQAGGKQRLLLPSRRGRRRCLAARCPALCLLAAAVCLHARFRLRGGALPDGGRQPKRSWQLVLHAAIAWLRASAGPALPGRKLGHGHQAQQLHVPARAGGKPFASGVARWACPLPAQALTSGGLKRNQTKTKWPLPPPCTHAPARPPTCQGGATGPRASPLHSRRAWGS